MLLAFVPELLILKGLSAEKADSISPGSFFLAKEYLIRGDVLNPGFGGPAKLEVTKMVSKIDFLLEMKITFKRKV